MPALITPFVKIAQSGPCADGRTIDPQWLRDMAETYDPEVYRAKIWPEHIRFGNNYGTVVELKAEETEGVVSLLARLAANAQYIWDNQYDQLLSFSIEVLENFAGSGKAYLAGLGITDSPASLGTDELKFARRLAMGGQQGARVFAGAPVESAHLTNNGDTPAGETAPGWFTHFCTKIFSREDIPMDKKQFEAFSARLDGLEARLDDIKSLVDGSFSGARPDQAPGADTASPAANAEASGAASDTQADAMRDSFAAAVQDRLSAAVAPLLESFKALEKRLAAAKPGAPVPDSTGPADDNSPIL